MCALDSSSLFRSLLLRAHSLPSTAFILFAPCFLLASSFSSCILLRPPRLSFYCHLPAASHSRPRTFDVRLILVARAMTVWQQQTHASALHARMCLLFLSSPLRALLFLSLRPWRIPRQPSRHLNLFASIVRFCICPATQSYTFSA